MAVPCQVLFFYFFFFPHPPCALTRELGFGGARGPTAEVGGTQRSLGGTEPPGICLVAWQRAFGERPPL